MNRKRFFRYLEYENIPINQYNTLHSESKITVMVSLFDNDSIALYVKDNSYKEIVCIENMSITDFRYLYFCFKLLTTERHANEYVESQNRRLFASSKDNGCGGFNVVIKDVATTEEHYLSDLKLVDSFNLMNIFRIFTMALPEGFYSE